MTLQRSVFAFTRGGTEIRALYTQRRQDGPDPNTKAWQTEISKLAREGLGAALEALEGGAEVVGTSSFPTREDVLSAPYPLPCARRVTKSGKRPGRSTDNESIGLE